MWDLTLLLKSHVLTQTGTASGRAGLLVQLFNTENTVAREQNRCSVTERGPRSSYYVHFCLGQKPVSLVAVYIDTNTGATYVSRTHVSFIAEISLSVQTFIVPL